MEEKTIGEFETFEFKRRKGIDNLKNIWAFRGNSHGDETRTNDIAAFLQSHGWLSYMFGEVPMDQLSIFNESERRKAINERYIRMLRATGRYGEVYSVKFHVKRNPMFDNLKFDIKPFQDFKIFIPDGKRLGS